MSLYFIYKIDKIKLNIVLLIIYPILTTVTIDENENIIIVINANPLLSMSAKCIASNNDTTSINNVPINIMGALL